MDEESTGRATDPTNSRRILVGVAVLLGVVLVALLVMLYFYLRGPAAASGEARRGVIPVLTIDGPGTGKLPRFAGPMGVAFARDGSIWVVDSGNDRICAFDAKGTFLFEMGSKGITKPLPGSKATWKPGTLNFPLGADTDEAGNLYVADFYNNQIQSFTPAGRPQARFPDPNKLTGKGGSGLDGTGISVTDVAVRGGRIYATDTWQVFSFDASGNLLGQFGKPGRGPADLDHPNGIAVARDGTIYVTDSNHSRVLAFLPNGELKWSVGQIRRGMDDRSATALELPRGIAVTDAGTVLVTDSFGFDIVAISPEGEVVGRYGSRGVGPGRFNFPTGIAVKGDLVLVADKANNRVQVVRLEGVR